MAPAGRCINMSNVKRSLNIMEDHEASQSPFMPMFEVFRAELDEHHDRRERVVKASRDITALSKKIIFALQRVRALNKPIPAKIAKETSTFFASIKTLFKSLEPDLQGIDSWRYQRQISGGIQEFMEAVSFEHYLTNQELITLEQSQAKIGCGIELISDDYVLGLFDMVGELMRFAITTMATNGCLPGSANTNSGGERNILIDLRSLRSSFEKLDTSSCGKSFLGKDVDKKMEVMKTCVEKVEYAAYGSIVRGRERPAGWIPDVPAAVESC